MSYRALLFCPDEKTARTVTQVLGELEFAVEACLEPFAAVKKLMGEHFDAIVVDCDNEQNAALLFKSARSSTSNQASLAVAVVEGQAGVAKAFRIGANLVLTKPINIEQSKGTLRVARGLLRKGDPAKPGIPAATAPAATPAKPAAPKPAATAKPAVASPTVAAARPAAAAVKPVAPAAKVAVASSTPAAPKEALPEISVMEEAAAPSAPAPRPVLGSHAASIDITSGFKPSASATPAPTSASAFSGGAASAPAPARELERPSAAETSAKSADADLLEKPAEAVASEASSSSSSSHASNASFTFGGANLPVESSGSNKKILLGLVAAVIVVAGLYFGWSYLQERSSQPTSVPATSSTSSVPAQSAAVPAQPAPKPVSAAPKAVSTAPATSSASSNVQTAPPSPAEDTQNIPDAVDNPSAQPAASTKLSATAAAGKSAKSEAAPLVVKGGSAPAVHAKPAAADTAAPSLIGMATPGAGAPPPNLGADTTKGPAPVLQTLNISQGVSQGLLIKKVQPIYPKNALAMHVEGAVELVATISTSGNITAVKIVKGEPTLTKAAADAVKQWKYKPYLLNGEPVEIQTQITVNFKLPH
jgi:periplasmic protein TonB